MVCNGTMVSQEGDGSWSVCLPEQLNMLVTALQDSLQHAHLCDVTVSVGGHCFHSHKFLLVAISNFFHGHFFAHLGECEVDISKLKSVSRDAFELFLHFAYSSKLRLQSLDDAEMMLKLARGLDTPAVRYACCEYLGATLTGDNCTDILSMAEEFHLPDLEKRARVLMNQRLVELSQTYMKQDELLAQSNHDEGGDNLGDMDITVSVNGAAEEPSTRRRKQLLRRSSSKATMTTNRTLLLPTTEALPGSRLRVETKAALKRFPAVHSRRSRKPAVPIQIIPDENTQLKESETGDDSCLVQDRQESLLEPVAPESGPSKETSNGTSNPLSLTKKTRDCKLCEQKDFQTLKALQDHCRKSHVRCTKCKRLFTSRSHLRSHMAFHNKGSRGRSAKKKEYDCSFCGKNCNYASALKVHLRTHTGDKPFACEFCPREFTQSINLYRHVLSYHRPDAPKYRCKVCGKEFSVAIYLKSHEVTHSEARPFQCEECGALFKRKNDLQSHARVHSSEKPHRCEREDCGSRFKTVGDLRTHARTHDDAKPHACGQCGKTFKRSCHLYRHVKIHSNEKPFQCGECSASFNRKENLQSHLRTHSAAFPYKCLECEAQYKHSSSLKAHSKKHRSNPGRVDQKYLIPGTDASVLDHAEDRPSPQLPTVLENVKDEEQARHPDASVAPPSEGLAPLLPTQGNSSQSYVPTQGGTLAANLSTKYLYLQNFHDPSKAGSTHTLIPFSDVFSEVGDPAVIEGTAGLPIQVMALPKQDDVEGPAMSAVLVNTSGDFVLSR